METTRQSRQRDSNGSYLRVFQAELFGQLLALGLGDVLLHLEAAFQAAPLQLGEHGPSHHSFFFYFIESSLMVNRFRKKKKQKKQTKPRPILHILHELFSLPTLPVSNGIYLQKYKKGHQNEEDDD